MQCHGNVRVSSTPQNQTGTARTVIKCSALPCNRPMESPTHHGKKPSLELTRHTRGRGCGNGSWSGRFWWWFARLRSLTYCGVVVGSGRVGSMALAKFAVLRFRGRHVMVSQPSFGSEIALVCKMPIQRLRMYGDEHMASDLEQEEPNMMR
jgi:hypothetical protein